MKSTIEIGANAVSLTQKEILFVHHYLGEAKMNATNAARMAGYSERTAGQQGYENLKKPEILEYIQFNTKAVFEELEITKERVIKELCAIAFANVGDILDKNWNLIDFDKIDPTKVGAIKSIKKNDRGFQVTFHDKFGALVKLLELFT